KTRRPGTSEIFSRTLKFWTLNSAVTAWESAFSAKRAKMRVALTGRDLMVVTGVVSAKMERLTKMRLKQGSHCIVAFEEFILRFNACGRTINLGNLCDNSISCLLVLRFCQRIHVLAFNEPVVLKFFAECQREGESESCEPAVDFFKTETARTDNSP